MNDDLLIHWFTYLVYASILTGATLATIGLWLFRYGVADGTVAVGVFALLAGIMLFGYGINRLVS